MKIVIDIPESMVTDIKDYCGMSITDAEEALPIILNAIEKCTPLPEGHGKLKDTDAFKQEILCHEYSNSFCEEHHIDHSINTEIALSIIDNAPTILEADKE